MTAKSVIIIPVCVDPDIVGGAVKLAWGAASPYMAMNTTKDRIQAYLSYARTPFRPIKLKAKLIQATIMTPTALEKELSDTALSAKPPVMQLIEVHPICSITFKAATIEEG